jgi:hypothetical protein
MLFSITIPFPCKTPSQNPLKQKVVAGCILECKHPGRGHGIHSIRILLHFIFVRLKRYVMGIMDYNDHPIQFDRFFTGNHLRNFKFSDIDGVILCR